MSYYCTLLKCYYCPLLKFSFLDFSLSYWYWLEILSWSNTDQVRFFPDWHTPTCTWVIIPLQQRWRGYSNTAVRGWLGEWVSGFVGWWVCQALPCGQDSNYSFCPITFKLHIKVVDDERRNPIDFGSQGQRSRSTLALCVWDRVNTIQTTVFVQSLSNFTCKLLMMRGGTLLIWGHGVKGQGQLWHSVYKTLWTRYRLQFLPNHFQTSHLSCGW